MVIQATPKMKRNTIWLGNRKTYIESVHTTGKSRNRFSHTSILIRQKKVSMYRHSLYAKHNVYSADTKHTPIMGSHTTTCIALMYAYDIMIKFTEMQTRNDYINKKRNHPDNRTRKSNFQSNTRTYNEENKRMRKTKKKTFNENNKENWSWSVSMEASCEREKEDFNSNRIVIWLRFGDESRILVVNVKCSQ